MVTFRLPQATSRLHRDSMPEVRAVINDAAEQLRPLLRPDQERRLDQMLARPRARWDLLESERKRDRARSPAPP